MSKNRKKLGRITFVRTGHQGFIWSDLYHWLLALTWWQFIFLIACFYLGANLLFAILFFLDPDGIVNSRSTHFSDYFFFSVQTMATIGYGAMYPKSIYSHSLVTLEVFIGLMGVALATSLTFARFSRPSARVLFSQVAVICPYNNIPTFMFRVANQRNNWIMEAQVRVSLLLPEETTPEGHSLRRLQDLKLTRSETPILALTWMIMHPIDSDSPLYGINEDTWINSNCQIIITLTGIDETVSQVLHTHHIYITENIYFNSRFVDVISNTPEGYRKIDYRLFHQVIPLDTGKL